jgi:hypothetical protein
MQIQLQFNKLFDLHFFTYYGHYFCLIWSKTAYDRQVLLMIGNVR